jgi:diacylglycerol kinase (ATP)
MKTLGLIVNPTSGAGRGKALGIEFAAGLVQLGINYLDLSARSAAEALAKGRAAITDGLIDGLVVLGGDGMVHLGVNLVAETELPLMVVGAGTGNDSARLFGMPIHDIPASLKYLAENLGSQRRVDAARVQNAAGVRTIFGSVSAGFDAIVNARANAMKFPKGKSKYSVGLFLELPKFRPINYRIVLDGVERKLEAMLIAVANAPAYGGGMLISPSSSVTDGLLDLFIVHKVSRLELVRLFPKVFSGRHITHPAVEFVSAKRVELYADNIPAVADGESVGRTPLTVDILPSALRLFG